MLDRYPIKASPTQARYVRSPALLSNSVSTSWLHLGQKALEEVSPKYAAIIKKRIGSNNHWISYQVGRWWILVRYIRKAILRYAEKSTPSHTGFENCFARKNSEKFWNWFLCSERASSSWSHALIGASRNNFLKISADLEFAPGYRARVQSPLTFTKVHFSQGNYIALNVVSVNVGKYLSIRKMLESRNKYPSWLLQVCTRSCLFGSI